MEVEVLSLWLILQAESSVLNMSLTVKHTQISFPKTKNKSEFHFSYFGALFFQH